MPRGNGTGPAGEGPMTGRGAGYCAGFNEPGFANAWPGAGRGRGFARGGRFGFRGGQGFRGGFAGRRAPLANEIEAEYGVIADQVKILQEQLNELQQRMRQLSAAAPLSESDQKIANSLYTDANKDESSEE